MRRPLVVAYDVTDDARRERVRTALRPAANWCQQSVWVIGPTSGLAADAVRDALGALLGPGDRLRVYGLCADCLRACRWAPDRPEPFGWYGPQVVAEVGEPPG